MGRTSAELGSLPAASTAKGFHDTTARANAYPLDGFDDESADSEHEHKGVTRHDRADMTRMGKVQELRVRLPHFPLMRLTDKLHNTEELQASLRHRIHRHLAGKPFQSPSFCAIN